MRSSAVKIRSNPSFARVLISWGILCLLILLPGGFSLSSRTYPQPPSWSAGSQERSIPAVAWKVQKSGTDASLRGVSAVEEKVAWASGSKGTVLRTVDGGETWSAMSVSGAESLDFRDIEAFSAETAYVMSSGRPAKIFKTEDGGETWREQYIDDSPGIFLDAFAFFDEENALVLGDPIDGRFVLLSTGFGGRLWNDMPETCRPEAEPGEGAFAAGGTCLIVNGNSHVWFCTGGSVSRVFHSMDQGKTWRAAPCPLLSGQPSFGAFSIAFLDDTNGIVVGGDYKNETAKVKNAAVTADGGKTWELIRDRRPEGFRECATFVPGTSPQMAVTVGPSGSDYSLDLGRTWNPIAGPAGFHSVGFAKTGKSGWAVGKGGLIAKFKTMDK